MKRIYTLIVFLSLFIGAAQGQKAAAPKVRDVFLDFLTEKMQLTPVEKKQMRPLIGNYFSETREINKTTDDQLLREQKRVNLKLKYRKAFAGIIGTNRATRFFTEEQIFRKKIREELRERKNVNKN